MEPFERLDDAMNTRRLELRLNWRQVADAAEISYTALRAIRRGDYRPTELTARRIDGALDWAPGTTLATLDGREQSALDPELGEPSASTSAGEPERQPTLSQELELAQRLLAATVREMHLTPQEADEVWQRVRLEIKVTHPSLKGDTDRNDRNSQAG
ncbi:helix-turn-helix domain-containing protein [Streptomyces galilaeus]|uniref:Helix-turn-helix domain-containing protein n=1 Tax=Streptomyces galilaeus TaxID=33899 RepID=A0ABW9IL35_STRGJ